MQSESIQRTIYYSSQNALHSRGEGFWGIVGSSQLSTGARTGGSDGFPLKYKARLSM